MFLKICCAYLCVCLRAFGPISPNPDPEYCLTETKHILLASYHSPQQHVWPMMRVKAVPLYDAFNVTSMFYVMWKGVGMIVLVGISAQVLTILRGRVHSQNKFKMGQTFLSLLDFSWTVLKSWNSRCLNSPSTRFLGTLIFALFSLLAN